MKKCSSEMHQFELTDPVDQIACLVFEESMPEK